MKRHLALAKIKTLEKELARAQGALQKLERDECPLVVGALLFTSDGQGYWVNSFQGEVLGGKAWAVWLAPRGEK